jgi:hypothetical protein
VQANQAGSHSTSTLLGASRIVAPTGTVVAEASRAVPGSLTRAELLVHRIDLHIAYEREGISGLLEDERHPDLYFDRVPGRDRLTCQSPAVAGRPSAARTRSRKMTYCSCASQGEDGQPGNQVRCLHNLTAGELAPGEIDIDSGETVPVVVALR